MRRGGALAAAIVLFYPAALNGQWVDAQLPRRGELQIGVAGQSGTVDHRFTADGTSQPLSEVFATTIDSRLAPPLDSLDAALSAFYPTLGLQIPEPSRLGIISYDVMVERTRAPISLTYSATDWLALFTVVPIVRAETFSVTQFDTTAADAGDVGSAFGDDPGAFFQGLNDGIAALESVIAADTLGAAEQQQAEALLADAQAMESGLTGLRDQVYVPTDSGSAGRDLAGFYGGMQSGFQDFEIDIPALSLARPINTSTGVDLTSGPEFGIEPPQTRDSGIKFGDIELGISLQPLNTFRATAKSPRPKVPVRVRMDALWRFATGSVPAANRLFDAGIGQGQPDLELRGALDVAYGGRIWMSLFAGYNIQMEADVERLITSRASPIQLGAYTGMVRWNPGDILTILVAPRFNFTRTITFSGLFRSQRHGRDRFEALDPIDPGAAFVPSDLEEGTEYSSRSIGFAIRYSTTDWAGDRRSGLPMEVELRYLKTTSGRDGFAPQRNVWEVATRLYATPFR